MFSATTLHDFTDLFSLLLAYCATIPFIGWFQAWVAYKAGDNAGKKMGLMNPNLINHVDPVGLIFLPIFGIGWGRRIPVRFQAISSSYRWIKFIAATFANTFAYFIFTSLTIMALSLFFNGSALSILVAHNGFNLTHAVGSNSAIKIAVAKLLQKMAILNIGMTNLSFVVNSCYVLVAMISQYWYKKTNNELNPETLFLLFVLVWLFFFRLPFGYYDSWIIF